MKLSKTEAYLFAEHAQFMTRLYECLAERQVVLHEGQIALARAYFVEKCKIIMSQWGRNAGKTETDILIAWIACNIFPNFIVYIVAPEEKLGYEVYFEPGRLQNFGPQEYIADIIKSDLVVRFTNGSYVKITGSNNPKAGRGVKPNLVIYDESQDHQTEFHTERMGPNLLGKKSSLIITGTPPKKRKNKNGELILHYYLKDQIKRAIREGDKTRRYFEFPTFINPIIDPHDLQRAIDDLVRAGMETVVKREYLGQDCLDGSSHVFPLWVKQNRSYVYEHDLLLSSVLSQGKNCNFYTIADPGQSCFAILLIAHNPISCQFIILDEIYEKRREFTDTKNMWERTIQKTKEIAPNARWRHFYDEAASYYAVEVMSNYQVALEKTQKRRSGGAENQISTIKMMMGTPNTLMISDRCHNLMLEINDYITDENGNYPKDNDHLVQCWFYGVDACRFSFIEKAVDVTQRIMISNEQVSKYTTARKKIESKSSFDDWDTQVVMDSLNMYDWEI